MSLDLTKPGIQILLFLLFIAYVVSPIDILPDIIPIFGRLDDLALLGYIFYRYSKRGQPQTTTGPDTRSESSFKEEAPRPAGKCSPYETLGLPPGASRDQIDESYRELAMKYHPDKVTHLGLEFQKLAHEKMIEIQRAYDELSR